MVSKMVILCVFLNTFAAYLAVRAQDSGGGNETKAAPPPEARDCNGIFVSYSFMSRTREYPHLKNATAQPWAFKSMLTILNAGLYELKNWKVFVGFRNREILISATNAVPVDGDDLPAPVGNGTTLSGYPQTDLKTSVDTAGDLTQIQAQVALTGTQFGIRPPGYPMPRTVKLVNDGYKCPAPKRSARRMRVCCVRDLKAKARNMTAKRSPRQNGDLIVSYDVLQAYESNYLAQVTIDNNNPLGRLDNWNLTWEWMRGEFIYTMRGAYARRKDVSNCIYGAAAGHYQDLDFSKVMTCEKKPIIGDLPPDRAKDKEIGNLPKCCRNGTILPTIMNETKSVSVFQMQVYKLPPDLNRTDLYPPERWKIVGVLNPQYKCGPIRRVDETEFPDPSGLQAVSLALASWQVVCNITRPKERQTRCCVSYSAYFNESVVPCNTCACGCESSERCHANARAMLLPPETLLVPFENRTEKAVKWARINHFKVPKPLPCPDNCGVSINWHVTGNYRKGWSVRVTLFNWEEVNFVDWFVAVRLNKTGSGFQKAYSFNGTLLEELNNTVFLTGLPRMNYLIGKTNGTNPEKDPKVPGKQQSVLTFSKQHLEDTHVTNADVFPTRLLFNGEECSLPIQIPKSDGCWCCPANFKYGPVYVCPIFCLENLRGIPPACHWKVMPIPDSAKANYNLSRRVSANDVHPQNKANRRGDFSPEELPPGASVVPPFSLQEIELITALTRHNRENVYARNSHATLTLTSNKSHLSLMISSAYGSEDELKLKKAIPCINL